MKLKKLVSFLFLAVFVVSLMTFFTRPSLSGFSFSESEPSSEPLSETRYYAFQAGIGLPYEEKKVNERWKKIVIWTNYFGIFGMWEHIFKRHFSGDCEELRCEIIINDVEMEIDDADAVIFDATSLHLKSRKKRKTTTLLPPVRKPNQIYVFFTMEPPTRFEAIDNKTLLDFFNWTMTYRRDSDVVVPYGKIYRLHNKEWKNAVRYATKEDLSKKKGAIHLNSHCWSRSGREKFLQQLDEQYPVDKIGKCYGKPCGSRNWIHKLHKVGGDECEKMFGNYKFFLALENSLCDDYVTEKLYRSLKLGVIPVVFGAVNYTEFAPPNSFIDAKKFDSVSDLAKFMTSVASNVNLYNEFFRWKENYEVEVGSPYMPMICDLCKKLHTVSSRTRKSYKNIREWFVTKSNCHNIY